MALERCNVSKDGNHIYQLIKPEDRLESRNLGATHLCVYCDKRVAMDDLSREWSK